MDLSGSDLAVLGAVAFAFGLIGSIVGADKKTGGGGGFWWGFLLGPLGVIIVALSVRAEPVEVEKPPKTAKVHTPPPPSAPAGWQPDPTGRFEHRYWDGSRWTEHVVTNNKQTTDQP